MNFICWHICWHSKLVFCHRNVEVCKKKKTHKKRVSLQSSCSLTSFDFGGKTLMICQSMDLKLVFKNTCSHRCFKCFSTCDTLTSQSGEARLSHGEHASWDASRRGRLGLIISSSSLHSFVPHGLTLSTALIWSLQGDDGSGDVWSHLPLLLWSDGQSEVTTVLAEWIKSVNVWYYGLLYLFYFPPPNPLDAPVMSDLTCKCPHPPSLCSSFE